MKMLAALKHRVDPEIQGLLPEAIELAKQKELKDPDHRSMSNQ